MRFKVLVYFQKNQQNKCVQNSVIKYEKTYGHRPEHCTLWEY